MIQYFMVNTVTTKWTASLEQNLITTTLNQQGVHNRLAPFSYKCSEHKTRYT